ncbi:MAG: choice-of-anchor Q domain-containing protein [Ilumatobacter sp.]|uniref:choice-of-anchor Q domain-containing protein n=1 Tax=Ilumatobacter sp. TaxID=1967498 RepID=UPI00391958F3
MVKPLTDNSGDVMHTTRQQRSSAHIGTALALAVGAGVVLFGAQPVAAASFVVTTDSATLDGTPVDPDGPDGELSLADAVFAANLTADLDTITFADGVTSIDTLEVPEITEDLVVEGPGQELLTLTSTDGPGLAVGNGADLTLSGVTIDGPVRSGAPPIRASGVEAQDAGAVSVTDVAISDVDKGIVMRDAMSAVDDSLNVSGVTISDAEGAGIETYDVDTVTVSAATIGGVAAGVTIDAEPATASTVSISGSQISTVPGLAIEVENGDMVAIADSVISGTGGIAVTDGGLQVGDAATFGTLVVIDTIGSNPAVSTGGIDDVDLTDVTVGRADDRGVEIGQAVTADMADVEVSETALEAVRVDDSTDVVMNRVSSALPRVGVIAGSVALADLGSVDLSEITVSGAIGADAAGLIMARIGDVTGNDMELTGNRIGMLAVDMDQAELGEVDASFNVDGGISISTSGDLELSDVTASGNGVDSPTAIGGIVISDSEVDSSGSMTRATISDNEAATYAGGFNFLDAQGDFVVSNSTISGNFGVLADAVGASSPSTNTLTITESVIRDNIGGSSATIGSGGAAVAINRSTVTGNDSIVLARAEANGASSGGIGFNDSTLTENTVSQALFDVDGAYAFADRSTVTGNAPVGASVGVFHRSGATGQMLATGSILTDNSMPLTAPGSTGPAPSVNYSLVPVGTPAGGTGNVATDEPQLAALADNGGPTLTMLPSPASPAVDAGDPAEASTAPDQRGFDRIVGGRVDMGAVERQQSPFVVSLPPARVLETRAGPTFRTIDGQFEGIGRRADGAQLTLPIVGRAGVPADAKAVIINITAVAPDGVGFVTAHPCLVNPPLASSLNFRLDAEAGNEIVAELNADGEICLFNRTSTDLVVDVVGYVPAESLYRPVAPARLLDTRDNGVTIDGLFQQTGQRPSDSQLTLDVAGRGGISANARAVVINVTTVKPTRVGYVTVHPCLPTEPTAASLNFAEGINRGNEIVAQLDENGRLCLYTFGATQLVVDVVGELTDELIYQPVAPARLVETRSAPNVSIDGAQQALGRLDAREVLRVEAAGRAGVPADASGVIANITAIRPEARGFITVWDCTGTMPLAASLNFAPGEIVGNELVIDLNADGEFCVFTNRVTDLTVDVVGFRSDPSSS